MINQEYVPIADFIASYNKTIPTSFPKANVALLAKFKESHSSLFNHGDMWSIDQHRKRVMDWLPQNTNLV